MGQTASRTAAPEPQQPDMQQRRRSALWRRSTTAQMMSQEQGASSNDIATPPSSSFRRRPASVNRLSQLLHSSTTTTTEQAATQPHEPPAGRPSRLHRASTSLSAAAMPSFPFFRRRREGNTSSQVEQMNRPPNRHARSDGAVATDPATPHVQVPALGLDNYFNESTTSISAGRPSTPRPRSPASRLRPAQLFRDLSQRGQQDRGMRNMTLRRRRSPLRQGEDNTALLSRLLSVAAAATAATLLEGNEQAMSEARSMARDGEDDGTFDGFLQSLESGRLAAALRQGTSGEGDPAGSTPAAPLNFFRMFRFGNGQNSQGNTAQRDNPANPRHNSRRENGDGASDGRMVPIIIVGIRAVTPGQGNGQDDMPVPPFLDALSALPTSPFGNDAAGHDSIENMLRPMRNATSFRHRRRASMDAPLRPRTARTRRLSESDYTRSTYANRRNGIVEPDHAPEQNTRSWIIYVLGGSYPENHPILTTPTLFTDSPSYEDMMLLSTLLGPAKPPVASEQDVADAPGIFRIRSVIRDGGAVLVAVAAEGEEMIDLATEQRCLVCLCDFEAKEEARRLIKCGHLFHRECIDEWLTKGRNSCPLCRGQGVHEKDKSTTPEASSDSSTPLPQPESSAAAA
ncbi:hypothetical protein H2203_002244 [Taxawa tesnikishii (nom. ined.)]|nr:hypothetical protein H2203_002244 [Dothideales sp. JES 119]